MLSYFLNFYLFIVARLEEKESIVKADFDKLHDRYTEVGIE